MTTTILGIKISTLPKQEILKKISNFLDLTPSPRLCQAGQNPSPKQERGAYIVTPNPEFLVAASKDEEFFYILNKAVLAIPDGIGLTFAGMLMGKFIKRVSGSDLMIDVCQLAEQQNKSIFLLGGKDNTAQQAAEKLKQKFPQLKIVGAEEGLKASEWKIEAGVWKKGKAKNKNLELKIKAAKPDIVFVAFGHPRQEKWMYHNLKNLPSVKLMMGIGGSFDFIAGKIRRAPKIFRLVALEWLWRLMQEPRKRWRRIYDAVIIFPIKFLLWRFIHPWFYRPNVACLLYKKDGANYKVLLAERRTPAGNWQLPQGGTDGEDLATAGSRELREEVGTDKFKSIATFKNLYRYKFNKNTASHQKLGYKGQKQGLFIAEFTGQDEDIIINFWDHRNWKWVSLNETANKVHYHRQEATKIFVEKLKDVI